MAEKSPPKTVIDAYRFHGLDLREDVGGQLRCDCPFCGKDKHFYVAGTGEKKGMWTCKFCQSGSNKGGGNLFTFLHLLIDHGRGVTTDADYKELWKKKRIPPASAKLAGLVKSPITQEWLFPTLNASESVINVHKWWEAKNKLYGTPTANVGLLGLQWLSPASDGKVLWLAEGHWDYVVMLYLIRKLGIEDSVEVLGVPGAGGFKEEWLKYLSGRTLVNLAFDNDHPRTLPSGKVVQPGRDGMIRLIRMATEQLEPSELPMFQTIYWPEESAHGFDIRDHYIANQIPEDCFSLLDSYLSEPPAEATEGITQSSSSGEPKAPPLEPIPSDDWDTFTGLLKENGMYLTPSLIQTFATMMAVSVSTNLEDDPLWLYVNGPPSSGKSTLCLCMQADTDHCVAVDKLTGIHSGYNAGGKGKSSKDTSMIPIMNKKTAIIKDFTAVLTLPPATQDQIFGELREIFDGTSNTHYRNGIRRHYGDIKFSMIAGVTDEIYVTNRAHLGERFFIIDITDAYHGSEDHVAAVLRSKANSIASSFPSRKAAALDAQEIPQDRMQMCRRITLGYMQHLHKLMQTIEPPEVPDFIMKKINSIARFIARVRAKVRRELSGDITIRVRPELGLRLSGQLLKLAISLGVVLQKKTLDKEVLNIIRKVARDTARGFHFDMIRSLASPPKGLPGLSRDQLAKRVQLSATSVTKRIDDLRELNIVSRVAMPNASGTRGRHRHLWQIRPEYLALWHDLEGIKPKVSVIDSDTDT